MASIILAERLRQKWRSSFGGDDEQCQWHLFREPIEVTTKYAVANYHVNVHSFEQHSVVNLTFSKYI